MKTVLIEIKNDEAYRLLQELESLNIIRLLEGKKQGQKEIAKRYAGRLSEDTADRMQDEINKSRDEWARTT